MESPHQRPWLAWGSVSLLALLCAGIAVLQYRWIGEIAGAQRTRLQQALQSRLNNLSREFNIDLSNSAASLMVNAAQVANSGREKAYSEQYAHWREAHPQHMFQRIALAVPRNGEVQLSLLDLEAGTFSPSAWPSEWDQTRGRLQQRLQGGGMPGMPGQSSDLVEVPRFEMKPGERRPAEQEWLLLQLNPDYLRGTLLPELLARYLGEDGQAVYEAELIDAGNALIYSSVPGRNTPVGGHADASVALFDIHPAMFPQRAGGPGGFPRGPGFGGGPPGSDGGRGRWRLLVRHKAGSLEALVAQTRTRNLALSGGILLLILATAALMVRFSRQAQRLAELQMNFVAGVSHELRTPLTVIRTAAFNLRGKLASRPDQVEQYGKLIQAESEKLEALVEQVLSFSSAQAGHVIRSLEPVAVEGLIEEGLRSSASHQDAGLVVDKQIDTGLPPMLADGIAMRQVVQNLVDNALKYGTETNKWIGISAAAVNGEAGRCVEIRVADHGPGIPADEEDRIFDPFFRGRRAVQDQVHGTGLGLNLVKKIVEAHGGTIRVESEPSRGTTFIVRIPAAPPELRDEFAHSIH